jgi:hypothetical protein
MDRCDAVGVAHPRFDAGSLELVAAFLFSGRTSHSVTICLEQLRKLNSSATAPDYDNSCHRLNLLA